MNVDKQGQGKDVEWEEKQIYIVYFEQGKY